MRAPISIVIPTLNSAQTLGGTLASLGEGLAAGLIRDLTVSDGGSEDTTCRIAEAAGACVISATAGRGNQLGRVARDTE
ncbi:MAG: glycosyltransferase, partial [Halocynthiibacter sp.]